MSSLAMFLGLLLWTWVWGGWGTLLAVPMLVVIKSVADHVDPLNRGPADGSVTIMRDVYATMERFELVR